MIFIYSNNIYLLKVSFHMFSHIISRKLPTYLTLVCQTHGQLYLLVCYEQSQLLEYFVVRYWKIRYIRTSYKRGESIDSIAIKRFYLFLTSHISNYLIIFVEELPFPKIIIKLYLIFFTG